jgi:plasmid stability protein
MNALPIRTVMASLTIRKLDDEVKSRLRVRAAAHGRSMEEEARAILRGALAHRPVAGAGLGQALNALFRPIGGLEIAPPVREPMREPPSFA